MVYIYSTSIKQVTKVTERTTHCVTMNCYKLNELSVWYVVSNRPLRRRAVVDIERLVDRDRPAVSCFRRARLPASDAPL